MFFPSGYVWYSIGGIGIAEGLVNSWNGMTGVVTVTTTQLPEGDNLYYTADRAQADVVVQSISDGDVDHSPSSDAIFDALAGKQEIGDYITELYDDVIASGPGSVSSTVAFVGSSSAANIHSAEVLANAATASNTADTIVRRASNGSFEASAIHYAGIVSFSVDERKIIDSTGQGSISGELRVLYGADGNVIMGWDDAINFPQLTADRVPYIDADKNLVVSAVTSTQLSYLDATSSIQTQINSKVGSASLGNLTESTSSVLTITGGTGATVGNVTVQVKQAATGQSGFLSSTDWNTFNGKQAGLTFGSISSPNAAISITNGANATVGPATTINIANADGATVGLLSSTDWTTFNGKMANPMTTLGDLVYRGASVPTRLPVGAVGQVLGVIAGVPAWVTAAGGGSKNYLSSYLGNAGNGDFELNATTGWNKCATTLTGVNPTGTLTTGTAGSITTFAVTNSSPLQNAYSLSVAASSAFTANQGICSDAFTIDIEDQAKSLSFKFAYKFISGVSNVNLSGTTANTFAVYIYDVTNSTWIQPSGCYNMVQGTGVGIATGTFQTTSNSTSYRIVVLCVNSSAGAAALYFDDFSIGPQVNVMGPAMTDWVNLGAMTINGFSSNPTKGTFSVDRLWMRRVGDSAHFRYEAKYTSAGSAGSGDYLFKLPSYLQIDNAKMQFFTSSVTNHAWTAENAIGSAVVTYQATNVGIGNVYAYDSTTVRIGNIQGTAAVPSGLVSFVGDSGYAMTGTSGSYSMDFVVPIVGWSSNSVMSSDTDSRLCLSKAYRAGANQTVPGTAVMTEIVFNTSVYDTHGAMNISNGRFTAPIAGYYEVNYDTEVTNGGTATGYIQTSIFKNGVTTGAMGQDFLDVMSAGGTYTFRGRTLIFLKAGEYVSLFVASGSQSVAIAGTGGANENSCFRVMKVTGPATVTAAEKVIARVSDTSSASITGSLIVYKFLTKTFDSHNCYSTTTGLFTCPAPGRYRVKATIFTNAVNLSTTQFIDIQLFKNGSYYSLMDLNYGGGVSRGQKMNGDDYVDCVTGDTLGVYAETSVNVTTSNGAGQVFAIFERVG